MWNSRTIKYSVWGALSGDTSKLVSAMYKTTAVLVSWSVFRDLLWQDLKLDFNLTSKRKLKCRCKSTFRITCTWVCMFVSWDRGWTEDKVWWGREGVGQGRPWSHNTPTANKRETKLPTQPIQTHSHHMTTLLWQRETVCVCCQWGGVVMWVSSREWNKWSEGDSLPHWDRQIILTQSVTIRGRLSQNF